MNKDIEQAINLLREGNYTFVACHGDVVHTSTCRGVKPLVALYANHTDLTDFSVADKVVGRATAFLYILHNVRHIHAGVISRAALSLLYDAKIAVDYDTLVDHIINRTGDDICPFEKAVLDIRNPETAYTIIREKMDALHITF